jgi:serine/threonine protein kinase/tetratricopeptide (TPR) repeat protein
VDGSSPPAGLAAGVTIGSYTIERLLGRGGMGEVYLAHDHRLDRPVALKFLPAEFAEDADERARLEREARMAAALRHPRICPIYEVGETPDGRPFIAMEYVEGATLQDRVTIDLFSVDEAIDIGIQIAEALEEARARGVVHRDLKSANIVLTPAGDVKVLDFGLAKRLEPYGTSDQTTESKLTSHGAVIGTAAYMAPEQALGRPVDHRSDLFAFGIVLYELLTGRLPFAGRTMMELLNAVVNHTPPAIPRFNEQVPDALVRVVGKLLEKNPAQRYQSARDVLNDLRRLRREGTSVPVVGAAQPDRHPTRIWPVTAALALTLMIGAAFVVWWRASHSRSSTDTLSLIVVPAQVWGPPQFEWMKDAVSSTLTPYLLDIESLEVKNAPTSLTLEGLKNDVQRLVRAYGVPRYIQPIVNAQPGKISMMLQLVDTDSQRVLAKGGSHDGTEEQYLLLIREAAEDVRQMVKPAAGALTATPAGVSVNSGAELAFRQGAYFWNRYNNSHDERDFTLALASLQRALDFDATLADAAAEIAFLYVFGVEAGKATADQIPQIEVWANRAVEKSAGRSGLGWAALAAAEGMKPKPDAHRALEYSIRAAALAPRVAIAHSLFNLGALKLRLAAVQESIRVDPLYLAGVWNAADALFLSGKSDEALALIDEALTRIPDAILPQIPKTEVLADLGRPDEAVSLVRFLHEKVQKGELADFFFLYPEIQLLLARQDSMAHVKLDVFVKGMRTGQWPDYFLSEGTELLLPFLAQHDRLDVALSLLEIARARIGWSPPYDWVSTDRRLELLRRDPRFTPMLRQSRADFLDLLYRLDGMEARGELPRYMKQPLAELNAQFKR